MTLPVLQTSTFSPPLACLSLGCRYTLLLMIFCTVAQALSASTVMGEPDCHLLHACTPYFSHLLAPNFPVGFSTRSIQLP